MLEPTLKHSENIYGELHLLKVTRSPRNNVFRVSLVRLAAIRRYRVFAEFSRHFCSARSGDARLAHSEKLARVPEKVHTRLGNVPRDPHTTFGGHTTFHVESRGLILPNPKSITFDTDVQKL